MNPYEILEISPRSDDADVRKAYLDLVRRYPPESNAEKFQEIHAAYEMIKDEKSRLNYYLFNRETGIRSPFGAVFNRFSNKSLRVPPAFEDMKEYIRKCSA